LWWGFALPKDIRSIPASRSNRWHLAQDENKQMSDTHEGYLLIADITGYTQYLSESELEHAQQTLTALLEMLVENTRPPLIISRLEGDAVISYGLKESFFQSQTLLEKIEDTYVAFRKTIERLVLNNTCRCNACANIANLDLKFFIHYGTFGIQHISDHAELVGSDVNLVHRLLKNSVTEKTGVRAYTLYTEAAIGRFGIEGLVDGMVTHHETYEHLGHVNVWVQDLASVWQKKRDTVTVTFPADKVWREYVVDIRLPREQVWDFLVTPQYRNIFMNADKMELTRGDNGRIAPGSIYQCYHGDKLIPQTILEWQPFERMIVKELFPLSPDVSILAEYCLESIESGTRFTRSVTKPNGPLIKRWVMVLMAPVFDRILTPVFEKFAQRVEEDARLQSLAVEKGQEITGEQIRQEARASLQGSAKPG
jgi:hypothetical protein